MTEKTIPQAEEVELVFDQADFAEVQTSTEPTESTKVKYNGQEMELSREELITNAQKGLNYDHIKTELDGYKTSEELKVLNEFAKEKGLKDWKEYVADLKNSKQNEKLESRVKELEADGMKPEHARKMAELELKAPTPPTDDVQRLESEFTTLHQEFPETQEFKELTDFPPEVIELIQKGKSPLVAYSKYLTENAKKLSEKAALDLKNKATDIGSLNGDKADEKEDLFLQGLLGK
jgi:hypothetical protein